MGCCVSKSQRYPILSKPYEDVMSHYSFGRMLGRGQFSVTYLCTQNSTNMPYACKSMAKKPKMKYAENDMMIRREIPIRRLLSGQPNIVELKSAHEDETAVHVVMELCQGGDLFDRIIAKGYYSERDAAPVLRAIVNAVNVWHSMGVMHRDLKPENFSFISRDDNALLKVTDFGSALLFEEGEKQKLMEKFREMDSDNSGTLTLSELKVGLTKRGSALEESEVNQYMEAGDIDGNGNIDFIEFVNLMTDIYKLETPELLEKAFQYLDKNGDQFIIVNELETTFKENNMGDDATIKEIISEVGRDHKDGRISFDQFCAFVKGGSQLRAHTLGNLNYMLKGKGQKFPVG